MIRFNCKTCGKNLKAPVELAGKNGKCSKCKTTNEIPVIAQEHLVAQVELAGSVALNSEPTTKRKFNFKRTAVLALGFFVLAGIAFGLIALVQYVSLPKFEFQRVQLRKPLPQEIADRLEKNYKDHQRKLEETRANLSALDSIGVRLPGSNNLRSMQRVESTKNHDYKTVFGNSCTEKKSTGTLEIEDLGTCVASFVEIQDEVHLISFAFENFNRQTYESYDWATIAAEKYGKLKQKGKDRWFEMRDGKLLVYNLGETTMFFIQTPEYEKLGEQAKRKKNEDRKNLNRSRANKF